MTQTLPTLETERLILRQRSLADVEAIVDMNFDPEVTRYISGSFLEREAHRREIIAKTERPTPPGLGFWSIFAKEEPARFHGYVLLIPLEWDGPEIEIGWRLPRAEWGKGYASEAAERLLRHGFETLALDEIIAVIDPANLRSRKVAERLGLAETGLRFAYGRDHALFTLSRQSWLERRAADGAQRPR